MIWNFLFRRGGKVSPSEDFWDTEPDFEGPAKPSIDEDGNRIWVPDPATTSPTMTVSPSPEVDPEEHDSGLRFYLDLSTGHLPQNIFEDLGNWSSLRVVQHEYGTILWVSSENYDDDPQWPEELSVVINWARKLNCDLINFDQDALKTDLLPYYDW